MLDFTIDKKNINVTDKNNCIISYEIITPLVYSGKNKHNPDFLNSIFVSENVYNSLSFKQLMLFSESTKMYKKVVAFCDNTLPDDVFIASNTVCSSLQIKQDDKCYLCDCTGLTFDKIRVQSIDNIMEDIVVISKKDYLDNTFNFNKDFNYYELNNSLTNESLIVKKSHIQVSEKLDKGIIQLNKKQRYLLNFDTIEILSKENLQVLNEKITNKDDLDLVNKLYENKGILDFTASFEDISKSQKIIKDILQPKLLLRPMLDSYKHKNKRTLLTFLADIFVGKSTISLACRRPYSSDETANIVRLTKSNMQLLGIDDTDNIVLSYKNKKVRCRVLEIEKEENFYKNNTPIDAELAIGVPAHVRKELGVENIKTSIKVDRDTKYIFKKNFNSQIIPILLTLLSTQVFVGFETFVPIIVQIFLIPLVIYLNLSSVRNARIK